MMLPLYTLRIWAAATGGLPSTGASPPTMRGSMMWRYRHGTPFRRAIEEGLLDPHRVVQIGIRGSIYEPGEHDWARARGVGVVYMEEFVERGLPAVMDEAREIVGGLATYGQYRSFNGPGNWYARAGRFFYSRGTAYDPSAEGMAPIEECAAFIKAHQA